MDASELALLGLAFVLTYAIHSTLLLGLACVIAPRFARSLALRERVWKTAMFGGIVTALVQVGASMETPLFHWTLRPQDGARESLAAANDPKEVLGARRNSAESDEPSSASASNLDSPESARPESLPSEARLARTRVPAPGASAQVGPHAPSGAQISDDETLRNAPEVAAAPERAPQALRERSTASSRVERDRAAHALEATEVPANSFGTSAATNPTFAASAPRAPSYASAAKTPSFAARWREWTAHGLLAWAAFGACVLALFGTMCLRLARRMRGRKELDAGPLRDALDRLLPQAFPAGRRVRLYVAPELRAPVSFGFVRFAICVPPRALAELSSDEQESMLAHELAHLMRRDPLWLSLAWLVERLFFFQPLHRVARAELHDLAELACDDWAARRTGDRLALASCLARIAEWIVGAPRSLPATSMAELHGRCRLAQRIERLLDEEEAPREEQARRWLAPAAAVGLGALVLVVPGVSAPGARRAAPTTREFGVFAEAPAGEFGAEAAETFGDELLVEPAAANLEASEVGEAPEPPAQPAARPQVPAPRAAASRARISSGGVVLNVPTAPEREALAADLASLSESLDALRNELEPVREDAEWLADDPQLSRALDDLAARIEQLERRRSALERLIQVLETLESMPAHPSSTPSATRNSRSFSQ